MYLTKLQERFANYIGTFCGYGVATKDFKNPQIFWNDNDTYIQKRRYCKGFRSYSSPDELFKEHMIKQKNIYTKIKWKKLIYGSYGEVYHK